MRVLAETIHANLSTFKIVLMDGKKNGKAKARTAIAALIVSKGGSAYAGMTCHEGTVSNWVEEGKTLAREEFRRMEELQKRGGSLESGNDSQPPVPPHSSAWHSLMESINTMMLVPAKKSTLSS